MAGTDSDLYGCILAGVVAALTEMLDEKYQPELRGAAHGILIEMLKMLDTMERIGVEHHKTLKDSLNDLHEGGKLNA